MENSLQPKHLDKYRKWLVEENGNKEGTARIYSRFLIRCADHYEEAIDENHLRYNTDVDAIVKRVSAVVEARGRWAPGTFNHWDVTRNLVFALKTYAKFVKANFPAR